MQTPILTVTPFDSCVVAFQNEANDFVYYCSNDRWKLDIYQATHYDSYELARSVATQKQPTLRFGLFVMKTPLAEAIGHMMDDLVSELADI